MTAINSINDKPSGMLYPNPVSGDYCSIQLDEKITHNIVDVCVSDMNGRTVQTGFTNNGNLIVLPLSHLANGVYLVKVIDNKSLLFFKGIVSH